MKVVRAIGAAFGATFDGRDVLLACGLGLVAYGVSLIYWPAAFIVPGAILAGVSIFGVR